MVTTYASLHENIQDAFNEAGVEIMSPTFHAVRDGNTVTTPAAYRPAAYAAPPFRIAMAGKTGQRSPEPGETRVAAT